MIIARGLGVPQFTDHATAVAYLGRLAAEPENRLLMRRTIAADRPLSGTLTDHDVLRELAWRLVRGELQVIVLAHPMSSLNPASSSAEAAPAPAPAPAASTVAETAPMREQEASPEDESVLPDECDEAAQAESLAAASEAGTPLCEV